MLKYPYEKWIALFLVCGIVIGAVILGTGIYYFISTIIY